MRCDETGLELDHDNIANVAIAKCSKVGAPFLCPNTTLESSPPTLPMDARFSSMPPAYLSRGPSLASSGMQQSLYATAPAPPSDVEVHRSLLGNLSTAFTELPRYLVPHNPGKEVEALLEFCQQVALSLQSSVDIVRVVCACDPVVPRLARCPFPSVAQNMDFRIKI